MKALVVIIVAIATIIVWRFICRILDNLQARYEAYRVIRKLERAARKDFIRVFGGIPKKTRKGIKVGKRLFKTEQDFELYMKKCLMEEQGGEK